MKQYLIKIIIWLFEKYAYDYWVDIQQEENKKEIMERHNLKSEEEFNEYMIHQADEPLIEVYMQGKEDGYEEGYENCERKYF
jgi:flagellar biosynthesis/type III secretory pathway protein FliH